MPAIENEKSYITVKKSTWSIVIVLYHNYAFQLIFIYSVYCTDLYFLIQDKQYNIKGDSTVKCSYYILRFTGKCWDFFVLIIHNQDIEGSQLVSTKEISMKAQKMTLCYFKACCGQKGVDIC